MPDQARPCPTKPDQCPTMPDQARPSPTETDRARPVGHRSGMVGESSWGGLLLEVEGKCNLSWASQISKIKYLNPITRIGCKLPHSYLNVIVKFGMLTSSYMILHKLCENLLCLAPPKSLFLNRTQTIKVLQLCQKTAIFKISQFPILIDKIPILGQLWSKIPIREIQLTT